MKFLLKLLAGKFGVYILPAIFAAGLISGGLFVNMVWGSAAKSSKIKALKADIKDEKKARQLETKAKDDAVGINDILRKTMGSLQISHTALVGENTELAKSRAPRRETVYSTVTEQINGLPDVNKCYSLVVDDSVRDIIWPRG